MDHLTIETPEQIPLSFLLAGIGSRFLALALDTLIQAAAFLVLAILGLVMGVVTLDAGGSGPTWFTAAVILAFFLVWFGYFAFFEAVWNGQTPGKRYLHLRVIKDDGRPLGALDALGRNLLRIVDMIPGIYAVGIVTALISQKNKRLGDYVAGTVVVHEKPLAEQGELGWDYGQSRPARVQPAARGARVGSVLNLTPEPQPAPQPEVDVAANSGYDVSRLSAEELNLMETFLMRRDQLSLDIRLQMARKIIDRIAAKLEISEDDRRDAQKLIGRLAAEYRSRGRYR